MIKKTFLILGLLLLSGCRASDLSLHNNTSPDQALDQFFAKLHQIPYYQIAITDLNEGERIETRVSFQAPDKYSVITNKNGQLLETIYSGQDTFVKSSGEPWYKLNISPLDPTSGQINYNLTELVSWSEADKADFIYQATNSCDGRQCHLYLKTEAGADIKVSIYADTFLLRKMTIMGEDAQTEMLFAYDSVDLHIPENYELFEIPENPSQEDLKKILRIYGEVVR